MSAAWGEGRVDRWEGRGVKVVGAGGLVEEVVVGSVAAVEEEGRRVVFVGAWLMIEVTRSGTEAGVTFSISVKAGRRRHVVGWL